MTYKLKTFYRRLHNIKRSSGYHVCSFLQSRTAVILSCVFIYISIVTVITQQQELFTATPTPGLNLPPVSFTELPFPNIVYDWSYDTSRNTNIYVQPNYTTTVHEPKDFCLAKNETGKLFLMVIVCSSAVNFERRKVIRETWGDYQKYQEGLIIFNKIQEKYNFKHDRLLQSNTSSKQFNESKRKTVTEIPEFRLAFLLGKPKENTSMVQESIDNEVQNFGDIIQEDFIDSYNNLTLKSIMMLKWISNKCHDDVRYVIKTDDDTYVYVPRLIKKLKSKSQAFDKKALNGHKNKEYLLLGHLIRGAKPIRDPNDKWYSPTYLFNGSLYPRYLSGVAYIMSTPTALILYDAALRTDFFHLEDIYITGICATKAKPRIAPKNDPLFNIHGTGTATLVSRCHAYTQITAHRLTPDRMRQFQSLVLVEAEADKCERIQH